MYVKKVYQGYVKSLCYEKIDNDEARKERKRLDNIAYGIQQAWHEDYKAYVTLERLKNIKAKMEALKT
tara:strand:- start:216 stop:419 length:204 start_codon:yes stop_codon:yes gene_type:complete